MFFQHVKETRDFFNIHIKIMDTTTNLRNDFSYSICEKDLVIENESLKIKLERVSMEHRFLRVEVKP